MVSCSYCAVVKSRKRKIYEPYCLSCNGGHKVCTNCLAKNMTVSSENSHSRGHGIGLMKCPPPKPVLPS